MKEGKTLQNLASEIMSLAKSNKDYIATTKHLHMLDNANIEMRVNEDILNFGPSNLAHRQIAEHVGIPAKYYDRMLEKSPLLLSSNVNHWFNSESSKRMIRTNGNRMRAFLSNRFRPLDYYDTVQAVIPVMSEFNCQVKSAELTESRLYIKAVAPMNTFEVKKGDVVMAGIVVSNSEVGMGSVKVEPFLMRLICTNGMIAQDYGMRKYHIGSNGYEYDIAREFFRDNTRVADDKAFWMKVQDVVRGSMSKDVLNRISNKMISSTEVAIEDGPVEVCKRLSANFGLSESEENDVLKHLCSGGDMSMWGLANAVTRASSDVESYDRATELERIGGDIIELSRQDWESIANK